MHTLGWHHGNEARTLTTPQLRKALRDHAAAHGDAGTPRYWLDFMSMPQTGAATAARGLAAWHGLFAEVPRCVLVIGEPTDTAAPPWDYRLRVAPLSLQRSWCCTELLVAAASRAEITFSLSFGALQALAERLGVRHGTPRPKVTAGLAAVWEGWLPQVALDAARCSDAADRSALRRAVRGAGSVCGAQRSVLRKTTTARGTTARPGATLTATRPRYTPRAPPWLQLHPRGPAGSVEKPEISKAPSRFSGRLGINSSDLFRRTP